MKAQKQDEQDVMKWKTASEHVDKSAQRGKDRRCKFNTKSPHFFFAIHVVLDLLHIEDQNDDFGGQL